MANVFASDIRVGVEPDGEGAGRVTLAWLNSAGAPECAIYRGYRGHQIRAALEASTAVNEKAREHFLIGLVMGITVGPRD